MKYRVNTIWIQYRSAYISKELCDRNGQNVRVLFNDLPPTTIPTSTAAATIIAWQLNYNQSSWHTLSIIYDCMVNQVTIWILYDDE